MRAATSAGLLVLLTYERDLAEPHLPVVIMTPRRLANIHYTYNAVAKLQSCSDLDHEPGDTFKGRACNCPAARGLLWLTTKNTVAQGYVQRQL